MSLDTTESIRDLYHDAVKQHVGQLLKTRQDYEAYDQIAQTRAQSILRETQAFHRDFDERLAHARHAILLEDTVPDLTHPPPLGTTPSDLLDTLESRAWVRVHQDHAHAITLIRDAETMEYQALEHSLKSRDPRTGDAQTAFTRALTRSGPDL